MIKAISPRMPPAIATFSSTSTIATMISTPIIAPTKFSPFRVDSSITVRMLQLSRARPGC